MRTNLLIASVATVLLLCAPGRTQQVKQKQGTAPPTARITITAVPPLGKGDPTITNPIAGTAMRKDISSCHVVVYAHTDAWYVQPTTDRPLTDIGDDGTWNTSTHPGDHYAALLVCGPYTPPEKIDSLPVRRVPVVAIDIKPKL